MKPTSILKISATTLLSASAGLIIALASSANAANVQAKKIDPKASQYFMSCSDISGQIKCRVTCDKETIIIESQNEISNSEASAACVALGSSLVTPNFNHTPKQNRMKQR